MLFDMNKYVYIILMSWRVKYSHSTNVIFGCFTRIIIEANILLLHFNNESPSWPKFNFLFTESRTFERGLGEFRMWWGRSEKWQLKRSFCHNIILQRNLMRMRRGDVSDYGDNHDRDRSSKDSKTLLKRNTRTIWFLDIDTRWGGG